MATYIKTVLPSGRGLWLEKLNTRQYRAVTERVATRMPVDATPMSMTTKISYEVLLASFRGITANIIPVKMTKPTESEEKAGFVPDFDIDEMLASVPENEWIKPTFEDLIIKDGERSLEVLLDDPVDFMAAEGIATQETFSGQSAMRGKVKREFVGR